MADKSSLFQVDVLEPQSGVKIWELGATEKINGAIAEIDGRYPSDGFVKNIKSDEVAYVIAGEGCLLQASGPEIEFNEGDQLTIPSGEGFAWQGSFKIYMACSPAFDPTQHVTAD